jgi:hypothetical protein
VEIPPWLVFLGAGKILARLRSSRAYWSSMITHARAKLTVFSRTMTKFSCD